MNRILFLDRDGVINHDAPTGIHSPAQWQAIPGSLEAIASLNRAGWQVFVMTNQSGIARQYYDLQALSDIHEKMLEELSSVGGCIQEIFFCPHGPDAGCDCRKPRPGMLLACQRKYGFPIEDVFFVGDKVSDVEAARAAGCQPLLVLTGQGAEARARLPEQSVPFFDDLDAVATWLLDRFPFPMES